MLIVFEIAGISDETQNRWVLQHKQRFFYSISCTKEFFIFKLKIPKENIPSFLEYFFQK